MISLGYLSRLFFSCGERTFSDAYKTTQSLVQITPVRHQAIIWINAWFISFRPLGYIWNNIKIFNKQMRFRMLIGKWRSFCLGFSAACNVDLGYFCHSANDFVYKNYTLRHVFFIESAGGSLILLDTVILYFICHISLSETLNLLW